MTVAPNIRITCLLVACILVSLLSSNRGFLKAEERGNKGLPKVPIVMPITAKKVDKHKVRLKWPSTLPAVSKKMPAYRILHPRLRADWEKRMIRVINKPIHEQENRIMVMSVATGAEFKVVMHPGGALDVKRIKDNCKHDNKKFLGAGECQKISKEFLEDKGLWEDNAVLGRVVDNTGGPGGSMSVGYKCRLDGALIDGPGARIIVEIGRDGRVQSVYKSWPTLQKIGDYPVISPKEAISRFRNGKGYFLWESHGEVKSLRLTYYAPPMLLGDYLVPTYVVIFRIQGDDEDLVGYLPAVEGHYLQKKTTKPTTQASTRPAS